MTHLLDVSNLDFLHPPRNVPIASFESPTSPVVLEKVCDDCWDQIHGMSRTPDSRPSTPLLVTSPSTSSSPSPTSSICASPIEQSPPSPKMGGKRSPSLLSTRKLPFPSAKPSGISDLEALQPSLGELDAYPLRRSSIICKATGGGRWEPKNSPPRIGLRMPGRKAPYEVEMEKEEQEERRRRMNPIVRDGGKLSPSFEVLHHQTDPLQSSSTDSGRTGYQPRVSLEALVACRPFKASLCLFFSFRFFDGLFQGAVVPLAVFFCFRFDPMRHP